MSSYGPRYVRDNGTFCVFIKFETRHNAVKLEKPIADWSKEWVAQNKHWHRVWMTGDPPIVSEEQDLEYFEIFTNPPYVIKADDTQLWLRLDGVYSYWWRDWGARIVVDLIRAFPALGKYELSFNCDEAAHIS